jgi:hypothetical protein
MQAPMSAIDRARVPGRVGRCKRSARGKAGCAPINSVVRLVLGVTDDAAGEPAAELSVERHTYPHKRKARSVCSQDRYLGSRPRKRRTRR